MVQVFRFPNPLLLWLGHAVAEYSIEFLYPEQFSFGGLLGFDIHLLLSHCEKCYLFAAID